MASVPRAMREPWLGTAVVEVASLQKTGLMGSAPMRIRIVKTLARSSIDAGLDRFKPGFLYEVDSAIGFLFIAEGWAEPVGPEALGLVETHLPSLTDAVAADIACDDAIAAAIERLTRRHE
jgi:hypothetical protein